MHMSKKVVVGLSGGVDSAVAAYLLKKQGFEVVGLFMRNWVEESEDGACTADEDFYDVRRVCGVLDIPYYGVDFSREYYDRVFKHFLSEYERGRTPNPDVLCNREIKFDAFADYARGMGADLIATGHYCRCERREDGNYLLRAADENKDQTYFLNQVTGAQLQDVIFPLGGLLKDEVRAIAAEAGLPVAKKKDSTGICFIGERDFRKFLSQYLPMQEGEIRTEDGRCVGRHRGVFYYTLGQRKGLGLGGIKGGTEGAWFVVGKDVKSNVLYVSQGDESRLFHDLIECDEFNFIPHAPKNAVFRCMARIRHRQPLFPATAYILENGGVRVECDEPQRAACAGQYVVLYDKEVCLGGGVMERIGDK